MQIWQPNCLARSTSNFYANPYGAKDKCVGQGELSEILLKRLFLIVA